MSPPTIDVVRGISSEEFVTRYIKANRPVVIKGALDSWKVEERWTPEHLKTHYGQEPVQLYNSYFDMQKQTRLANYFATHFGRSDEMTSDEAQYVRWYTQFRDANFWWADRAFARMKESWSRPDFLPVDDYVLPFAPAPTTMDPTTDRCPARGLFISKRGARTGLHVDPWGSDAVLCQLYGRKSWTMYGPEKAEHLIAHDGAVVDPDRPDHAKFPQFASTSPTYETFFIDPGDSVYVPHGWYHHVKSETDSISLTWNFVHRETVRAFLDWLSQPQAKAQQEVVAYFFQDALGKGATMADVHAFVHAKFVTTTS